MNTITIELCPEDRERLDKILEALTSHNCAACAEANTEFVAKFVADKLEPIQETAQDAAGATAEEPAPVHTLEPEPATEVKEPAKAAPEKAVQVEDIKKKVVELTAAGKKAEARAIIMEYADRVSAIPADKLSEVWDKLTALEG